MGGWAATTPERYVALGDSYTIGEGVEATDAWPSRLVAHLRGNGVVIELIANPSVTGWTTADLIANELPVLDRSAATFVTLLIGVNDWVRDVPAATFAANLAEIVARVQAALPDPRRLLLLTIPDFSVTPTGPRYARGRDISRGIAGFNRIIRDQAERSRSSLVDLFPFSQRLTDSAFVAADGLHPSALAHARWEEIVYPVAAMMFT